MTDNDQYTWENTIDFILGDENPCRECIVRATCTKSFTMVNSACEKLAKKLEERIYEKRENQD